MVDLFNPIKSIGLELSSSTLLGAEVQQQGGKSVITQLFGCGVDAIPEYVKQLYMGQPFITTSLEGNEALIRPITIPLVKEKDIEAALAFQAEPILPYPVDEALLARQTLRREAESTDLTLLSTRKNLLQSHLEKWRHLQIEPERVGSIQSALCQFTKTYLEADKAYLLFHMQDKSTTCVLIDEGQLISSFSQAEGFNILYQSYHADAEGKSDFPFFDQIDYSSLDAKKTPHLCEAVAKLQKLTAMMGLALIKELHGKACEGIVCTGEVVHLPGLEACLTTLLKQPLVTCTPPNDHYSAQDLQRHAVSLGLAIGSLPQAKDPVDFRQQELSYPHPWKRLQKPMAIYFAGMVCLCAVFYFFGQTYLSHREDHVKQEYINLLGNMNKSYDQFETSYLAKNPSEKKEGELAPIESLNREQLLNRLTFLQRDLQATPDSFPLFANIPRVSDLIAWLNQHDAVMEKNDEGTTQSRIQIENLSYMLVKRPMQNKKTDKYQVKVELEFSSPTPKWAREFHDALIAPNDWIDPKGEVKWSSNRGKYKTSFFLKDKTFYPGQ